MWKKKKRLVLSEGVIISKTSPRGETWPQQLFLTYEIPRGSTVFGKNGTLLPWRNEEPPNPWTIQDLLLGNLVHKVTKTPYAQGRDCPLTRSSRIVYVETGALCRRKRRHGEAWAFLLRVSSKRHFSKQYWPILQSCALLQQFFCSMPAANSAFLRLIRTSFNTAELAFCSVFPAYFSYPWLIRTSVKAAQFNTRPCPMPDAYSSSHSLIRTSFKDSYTYFDGEWWV